MSNTTSKNEIEAYGRKVEMLQQMHGSFGPYLMMTVRLMSALARNPGLRDQFDPDDLEIVALLHEHFYQLMIIWDRYRPDRELDDSEMNMARKIMNDNSHLSEDLRKQIADKLDSQKGK